MVLSQKTFGLGRLENHDRRYIEWEIEEICELRTKYLKLSNQVKWKNVLHPKESLEELVDEWVYVSDCLWFHYTVIYAWLCFLDKQMVWAELGYELFYE